MTQDGALNRWRRYDTWDERALRLDKFAHESPADGFCAAQSPNDPAPSIQIENDRVVEMDGVSADEFDMIDAFIAAHYVDPEIADEAMALDSVEFARMLVDIHVPRADVVRLARGMTPAKLAEVLWQLSTLELTFAQAKLRARKTPANQAHVTNAKDDPVQLAADAATASAIGFDEIETTMRVAENAWSNALACTIGAAVGRGGTLFQCSFEEAEELRLGMAGLTSYAETVSVYGSEGSFVDGDDTPWSKAFLTAAYASRGIKARCTSGAGSELLMGFHEARSILYLEARCLCIQKSIGVQGTQNGGIDGAPVTASVPGGLREILAENVMAALLDLECASGNDTRFSESEIRVGAKIMPYMMAGTDFICSGLGSIPKYDNSFGASLFNAEEMEDYLAVQRDFEVEGGIRHVPEDEVMGLRARAIDALEAVLDELGLAQLRPEQKASVLSANGSKDTDTFSFAEVRRIAAGLQAQEITVLDIVAALDRRGFSDVAQNILDLMKQRVSGDYLQTAAIVREGRVLSAVNDANDYAGPGTGYRISPARRAEIAAIRDILSKDEIYARAARDAIEERRRYRLEPIGPAQIGSAPGEVTIGLSPAFGDELHRTTGESLLSDVLDALIGGIEEAGGTARLIRMHHTADTSFMGLSAARLSGSGIGIGIQAKGTAVIHRSDLYPHMNLELFCQAPITELSHYRQMGRNAAAYAKGEDPEPISIPYQGEALGARFHVQTSLIYAIETALLDPVRKPEELKVTFLDRR
jgi:propanediol dehydratase large subunit